MGLNFEYIGLLKVVCHMSVNLYWQGKMGIQLISSTRKVIMVLTQR